MEARAPFPCHAIAECVNVCDNDTRIVWHAKLRATMKKMFEISCREFVKVQHSNVEKKPSISEFRMFNTMRVARHTKLHTLEYIWLMCVHIVR